MNLLLLLPDEVASDGSATLDGSRARHIVDVLRAEPARHLRVGLVNGAVGTGTVLEVDGGRVRLQCAFERVPPLPGLDLILALPRPKVLRRLWAQIAAIGVRRIILTNAARVERNYFDTHVLDPSVYRPLLLEGLQQARDTHVPLVTVHRQFRILVEDELPALVGPALRVMADPGAAASIGDLVRGASEPRVALAVGPEGGWNGFERDRLQAQGFLPASMGERTLRSDTACIALMALAHDAMRGRAEAPG